MLRRQIITQAEREPSDSFLIQNPFMRPKSRVKSVAEEYDEYIKLLNDISRFDRERVNFGLINADASHTIRNRNKRIQEALEQTNNLILRDLMAPELGQRIQQGLNRVSRLRALDTIEMPTNYMPMRPSSFFTNLLGITPENVNTFSRTIQNQFEVSQAPPTQEETRSLKSIQNFANMLDAQFKAQAESEERRMREEKFEFETLGGSLPTTEQGAEFTANSADDLLETTLVPAPPTPEQQPITPLTRAVPGERTPEGAMTPMTQIVPGERTPTRAMTPLTQAVPAPATPVRSPFERTTSFSKGELLQASLGAYGFGNITSIQMDDFTLPPPTVGYDEHYHKQHSMVKNEEVEQEDGTRIFLRPAFRVPLRAQPASSRTEQNQGEEPEPVVEPEEPEPVAPIRPIDPDPDADPIPIEPIKPIDPNPPNPDPGFPF